MFFSGIHAWILYIISALNIAFFGLGTEMFKVVDNSSVTFIAEDVAKSANECKQTGTQTADISTGEWLVQNPLIRFYGFIYVRHLTFLIS